MIIVHLRKNLNPENVAIESPMEEHCSNIKELKINGFNNDITRALCNLSSLVFKLGFDKTGPLSMGAIILGFISFQTYFWSILNLTRDRVWSRNVNKWIRNRLRWLSGSRMVTSYLIFWNPKKWHPDSNYFSKRWN